DADSLSAFLEHARARIDNALERYLPRPPACPPLVSDAMRYSVFAGGKRLRPALALASADAVARHRTLPSHPFDPSLPSDPSNRAHVFRDATSLALPAACALELIHTYSL